MTKHPYRRTVALTRPFLAGLIAALAFCLPPKSGAITAGATRTVTAPLASLVPVTTAQQAPAVDNYPVLDTKRLFALGMIETGNNDRAVGLAGEISRYQLSPSVWKTYSKSVEYRNPDLALQVARLHWSYLAAYFKEKTGRLPGDYDMYVLWNTRYGYYARHNFSKRSLALVVQDRAQRFVNLVNRKD